MKFRVVTPLMIAAFAFACGDGQSDPLSSNHSVAARTVTGDLTIAHLDSLFKLADTSSARTFDGSLAIARLWASYQRLAVAAANDDTLSDVLDRTIEPIVEYTTVTSLLERLRRTAPVDTATAETYHDVVHDVLAARSIYMRYPAGSTSLQRDSVMAEASKLRFALTPKNFGEMASKRSDDRESAPRGGALILFKDIVAPDLFEVLSTLKPDSITGVVAANGGVAIYQRMSYADAREDYKRAYAVAVDIARDSTASDVAAVRAEFQLNDDAESLVRLAVVDPLRYMNDSTPLATFNRSGTLTVAHFVSMFQNLDEQKHDLYARTLPRSSDSVVTAFVETVAGRAILARSADSAGIAVSAEGKAQLKNAIKIEVTNIWTALGISPQQLHNEAPSAAQRQKIAIARVDSLLTTALRRKSRLPRPPQRVERALDCKYKALVSLPAIRAWIARSEQ